MMDWKLINSELSAFLSVLIGSSILCSVLSNLWLVYKRYRKESQTFNLCPYLLSSCAADTLLTCITGPTICVMLSSKNLTYDKATCVALDVVFLALLWSSILSQLIYSLDRHCLLAARRLYPDTFGRLRRNVVTITLIWIIAVVTSLIYISIRQDQSNRVPLTFSFTLNMLYCCVAIVVLDFLPIFVIVASLIKTLIAVRYRRTLSHRASKRIQQKNNEAKTLHQVAEDTESFYGTFASSTMLILAILPWTTHILLKSLKLHGKDSADVEIILLSILISGIGAKNFAYILGCGFLRRSLFSVLLRQNSGQFTVEQPSVISNIAVVGNS